MHCSCLAGGAQRLVLSLIEREADGTPAGANGIEEIKLDDPPTADKASAPPRKHIKAVGMLKAQPNRQHLSCIGIPKSAVPPPLQKAKVHPDAVSSSGRTMLAIGLPPSRAPRKRRLAEAANAAGQLLAFVDVQPSICGFNLRTRHHQVHLDYCFVLQELLLCGPPRRATETCGPTRYVVESRCGSRRPSLRVR